MSKLGDIVATTFKTTFSKNKVKVYIIAEAPVRDCGVKQLEGARRKTCHQHVTCRGSGGDRLEFRVMETCQEGSSRAGALSQNSIVFTAPGYSIANLAASHCVRALAALLFESGSLS